MMGHQRKERDVWSGQWGKGGVQRTWDLSWVLISTGLEGVWDGGLGGKNVPNKGWGFSGYVERLCVPA